MPKVKIETSQNVQLSFQLATLGERIVATLIDRVLLVIYLFGAISLFDALDIFESDQGYYFFVFLFSLPAVLFALIMEFSTNGQSLGKYMLKIRVLKTDGTSPAFFDLALRWIFRFIDLYFIFFILILIGGSNAQSFIGFSVIPIIAIVSISMSKENQRIGDLIANTVVVRKITSISINDTVLPYLKLKDYQPTFLNALELNDRDVRIIKKIIETNDSNSELINKLARKAKEILNISSNLPDRKFLIKLMKDYNYLAIIEDRNKA